MSWWLKRGRQPSIRFRRTSESVAKGDRKVLPALFFWSSISNLLVFDTGRIEGYGVFHGRELSIRLPLKLLLMLLLREEECEKSVFTYGPHKTLFTDNGPQLTAKLFQMACCLISVNNFYTTVFHLRKNDKTKRLNRALCSMLSHYVVDDQQKWEKTFLR